MPMRKDPVEGGLGIDQDGVMLRSQLPDHLPVAVHHGPHRVGAVGLHIIGCHQHQAAHQRPGLAEQFREGAPLFIQADLDLVLER